MSFEEILPRLKKGGKIIRKGWSGVEEYVILVNEGIYESKVVTPHFLIKTSDEGYSMFSPTVCDILATDWEIVE
ncbi:DUF2829 domain-containing protein [Vagococcus intermedius]|uniref:DUF2829 domain-containing protein n=1 Tax=Vagococcus intermedius TaxID=2991418 RepID=A0AAF0CUK0_9ENTE|nr:DUF2829 domain-containing protein [Vagococcus intermedius]WEG73136.1 DUF2829 domain-containing protein [Vagococcus intermedius]WEG75220.1 DUF2829 domain-containing protein [Vagococcus intermedius]